MIHEHKIRIYYEDTDSGGVVYYANYLKFLERARTEFLRDFSFNQAELTAQHSLAFVVKNVSLDYVRPARLDDKIKVKTSIEKLNRTSMFFTQNIYRQTDLLITAKVQVVCLKINKFKPCKIPDFILDKIKV